jgi:DNA polymerase-1
MTDPKAPKALCHECPLAEAAMVCGRGPLPSEYIIVGESPGATEVRLGKPFVGPSGKLLERALDVLSVPMDGVRITNAVLCHPGRGQAKENVLEEARRCCRPRLLQELQQANPNVIISLGRYAAESLLNSSQGIMSIRGSFQESEELPAPVLPTLHPAAVLRKPDLFQDFHSDLKTAFRPPMPDLVFPVGPEQYRVIDTVSEAVAFLLTTASVQPEIAFDLETSGFDMIDDLILCMVFCWDRLEATIIKGQVLYRPEVAGALRQVFNGRGRKWIGHGAKFDICFLQAQLGTAPRIHFDTLLAHYALDERRGTHDLKVLCRQLFQAPDWEGDIRRYLSKPRTDSYALLPAAVLYKYAAHDGVYTWRLYQYYLKELAKHPRLLNLFQELLVPAQNALAGVELYGVSVSEEVASSVGDDLEARLFELEDQMCEMLNDVEFNPNSPQQVAAAMFDRFKLPKIQGRSTNSKSVLPRLMDAHPFVPLIAEYRKASKLFSTYVDKMPRMRSSDGRVHGSFMVHGTVTGRLASRNPNLQNIPRESRVKDMFVSSPSSVLVMGDYSQAEFRMLGYYSGDEWLLRVFREGRDLHGETATEMFGPNYTKEERVVGKMVNFGLTYGRTPEAMAEDVRLPGMNKARAVAFIQKYFGRMPVAQQWIKDTIKQARAQGYLENAFGRRRRFPLITRANVRDVERQAVNFMCQSTASDITLLSLIRLHELFETVHSSLDVHILLTVHDSILVECPTINLSKVASVVKTVMEDIPLRTLGPLMPFTVDISYGTRWGSLKDYAFEETEHANDSRTSPDRSDAGTGSH